MKSKAKVFTLPTEHSKVAEAVLTGAHEIAITAEPDGSLIVLGDHHLATRLIASGQKITLKRITNHPNGAISWLTSPELPLQVVPIISQVLLDHH